MLGPAWQAKGAPPLGYFTKRTANEALEAILTDARRGVIDTPTSSDVTFTEVADAWLDYVTTDRKRKRSTIVGYTSTNRVLIREFGELLLQRVTADRIDHYRRQLVRDGGLSPRSVNKRLIQIHSILSFAQRRYGLAGNPAAQVDRQPLRATGAFNVLSPAEVEAVARAAGSAQDSVLIRVAAYTGLRMGELRALRWEDVDFGKSLIHVRKSYTSRVEDDPKSNKVRSVPLIDQASIALGELGNREQFAEPDDLVFPSTTGSYSDEGTMRRAFYAALKAAGISRLTRSGKPIVFHDLRHTFGTLAVQAFPLSDVRAYMGHADISTTMIYVHHVPRHDAAEKLSRVVAAERGVQEAAPAPATDNVTL